MFKKLFSGMLMRKLSEPSTWAGIVAMITAICGVTLDQSQREAAIAVGVGLMGLIMPMIKESGHNAAKREAEAKAIVLSEVKRGMDDRADDEKAEDFAREVEHVREQEHKESAAPTRQAQGSPAAPARVERNESHATRATSNQAPDARAPAPKGPAPPLRGRFGPGKVGRNR